MVSSLLAAFILPFFTLADAAPVSPLPFGLSAALTSGGHTIRLQSSVHGGHDVADVTINGKPLRLVVDTGSADTWVFHKAVICAEGQDVHVPTDRCLIGQVYRGNVTAMPEVHFQGTYGGGSVTFAGVYALAEVKISDIVLQRQQIAFVEHQKGNPLLGADGILGLAPK